MSAVKYCVILIDTYDKQISTYASTKTNVESSFTKKKFSGDLDVGGNTVNSNLRAKLELKKACLYLLTL